MHDRGTVLVTGASSGVGLALSELLCATGYRVVAVARHIESLRTLPVEAHALDITDRALEAEYVLSPLDDGSPPTLELRGSAVRLVLNAAAGLRPRSSSVQLTVKHLGRELNAASSEPPTETPNAGLRVSGSRFVAGSMAVAPRPEQAVSSVSKIASARLHLAAAQPAGR